MQIKEEDSKAKNTIEMEAMKNNFSFQKKELENKITQISKAHIEKWKN